MSMLSSFLRVLKGDGFLRQFSCSQSRLLEELDGQRVAIVGNARSLNEREYGDQIDACDIVIRMHAAPLTSAKSHGSRTNWLALGMPISQDLIAERAPEKLLWMAKKRKRVRARIAKHSGFYLHPKTDWDRMAGILEAPPTTGAMLIELAAISKASEIHLFGFDFFASLSLSGRRTAAQVPHDFAAEKTFVEDLIRRDARVVLHK